MTFVIRLTATVLLTPFFFQAALAAGHTSAKRIAAIKLVAFFTALTCLPAASKADVGSSLERCRAEMKRNFSVLKATLSYKIANEPGVTNLAIHRATRKKQQADFLLRQAGLNIPTSVSVEPTSQMGSSIYLYGPNLLKFDVASATDPEWSRLYSNPDEDLSGPTFIHEYAHAAFWNSLNQIRVPWRELKYSGEVHACTKSRLVSEAEKHQLRKYVQSTFSKPFPKSKLALYDLHRIVVPYTEFYSDLVSALVYDNPSVENRPITPYTEPDEEAHDRDFTTAKKIILDDRNAHIWLAEARYTLYTSAWKPKMSVSKKIEILRKVFEVFKEEIEYKWSTNLVSENRIVQVSRVSAKIKVAFDQGRAAN